MAVKVLDLRVLDRCCYCIILLLDVVVTDHWEQLGFNKHVQSGSLGLLLSNDMKLFIISINA